MRNLGAKKIRPIISGPKSRNMGVTKMEPFILEKKKLSFKKHGIKHGVKIR